MSEVEKVGTVFAGLWGRLAGLSLCRHPDIDQASGVQECRYFLLKYPVATEAVLNPECPPTKRTALASQMQHG